MYNITPCMRTWREVRNFVSQKFRLTTGLSTGVIQYAQAYAVFCWNIVAYMVVNGLSCSWAVAEPSPESLQ